MTFKPPNSRPTMRLDLTRWNRAGRDHFDYVDGDAAVWLEELRIAMLGLAAPGAPWEQRVPEYWRDLVMKKPESEWPYREDEGPFTEALLWEAIRTRFPEESLTARQRSAALLAQYAEQHRDYGREIHRAFARACHVLLGHLNAHANEGYVRTATQWNSLRRLGSMVNYLPTPAASATTKVGLVLDSNKQPAVIRRGLAMQWASPEGGMPLIFETLTDLECAPALNRMQVAGARHDARKLADAEGPLTWLAPKAVALQPGSLGVLFSSQSPAKGPVARAIKSVTRPAEQLAIIDFAAAVHSDLHRGHAILACDPADVRVGVTRSVKPSNNQPGLLVLAIPAAEIYGVGDMVQLVNSRGDREIGTVARSGAGHLVLETDASHDVAWRVEQMTPHLMTNSEHRTPHTVQTLWFALSSGGFAASSSETVAPQDPSGVTLFDLTTTDPLYRRHQPPVGAIGSGWAVSASAPARTGTVVNDPNEIVPGSGPPGARSVRFDGKAPTFEAGDWFVAKDRSDGQLTALQAQGVRTEEGAYTIEFHTRFDGDPANTDFHGPLRHRLKLLHSDRSVDPVAPGFAAVFDDLDTATAELIRPGREVIVEEAPPTAGKRYAWARVVSAMEVPKSRGRLRVTLSSTTDFTGWVSGWTSFNLNVVEASHGETKDPTVLGSGDGERKRQDFILDTKNLSFVPSSAAESGVEPDIDVEVAGVRYAYRDAIDPSAEDTDAFSVAVQDDDRPQIRLRRRLPTGRDNVVARRWRVGAGAAGNGVPALAFSEPMKKHPLVTGLLQPFPASGGADREPVASIRSNVAGRIPANGRAVSAKDFERLTLRHTAVLHASAQQVSTGRGFAVDITMVPVGGGASTPGLRRNIEQYLRDRAADGTRVRIADYEPVRLVVAAIVRVDADRYDLEKTQLAAQIALERAFAFDQRGLGQAAYIGEVLHVLEQVEGVSSAVVTTFGLTPGSAAPLRVSPAAGPVRAIHPYPHQLIAVVATGDAAVTAEQA